MKVVFLFFCRVISRSHLSLAGISEIDNHHSHPLHSNFQYETNIGISPYHTLAVVELQSMEVMEVMT